MGILAKLSGREAILLRDEDVPTNGVDFREPVRRRWSRMLGNDPNEVKALGDMYQEQP